MNKVDEYYNKLLSIVNKKYKGIKDLSNNYDIRAVIEVIIESGNEFILSEEYLYCFVMISIDSSNFKDELGKLLYGFTTKDKDKLINNLISFYDSIFYINDIDIEYNNLHELGYFIYGNKIKLLKDLKEVTNYIDNKLNSSDYFLIRDIFYVILAYCILNKKEEYFYEYCRPYTNNSNAMIESLILNGIVVEAKDTNTDLVDYYVSDQELNKYIIASIDKSNKKLIK